MFNDRIVRQMTGRSIGAIICFSQSRPERPLVEPPAHEKAKQKTKKNKDINYWILAFASMTRR